MNIYLNSQESVHYPAKLQLHALQVLPTEQFLSMIQGMEQNKKDLDILDKEVFFFQVEYDHQVWTIRKQANQVLSLNAWLATHYPAELMPSRKTPSRLYSPLLSSQLSSPALSLSEKLMAIEMYLSALAEHAPALRLDLVRQFFELSAHEYQENIVKYKEFFAFKRQGGRQSDGCCKSACVCLCSTFLWTLRYFQITSEGIQFSKGALHHEAELRENLLFDQQFMMEYDRKGSYDSRKIRLKYSQRRLTLTALSLFEFYDILYSISEASSKSIYTNLQRHLSYAPVRDKGYCKMYVDGQDYFSDVCDSLLAARNEVFIAGWWVSPQMYLKRPVGGTYNQDSRLDRVLTRVAQKGVQVRIIIWNAPSIALTIDSQYTQKHLMALHENIVVIRHPQYILPTFLWSHHEKMVVIDQQAGFLGGLDLCYGRMDNQSHRLAECEETFDNHRFWPGIDYSNVRIKDFANIQKIHQNSIDPLCQPRLPWHDIACLLRGEAVRDLSRHFVQYWNFCKMDIAQQMAKHQLINVNNNGSLLDRKGRALVGKMKQLGSKLKKFLEKPFREKEYDDIERVEQDSRHSAVYSSERGIAKNTQRQTLHSRGIKEFIQMQHLGIRGDQQSLGEECSELQIQNRPSDTSRGTLKKHHVQGNKMSNLQTSNKIQSLSQCHLDKYQSNDHFENHSELPQFYQAMNEEFEVRQDQQKQFVQLLHQMEDQVNQEDPPFMSKNEVYQQKNKSKRAKILKRIKSIYGTFRQDLDNDKIVNNKYKLNLKTNKLRRQEPAKEEERHGYVSQNCRCQMLRSASEWSLGLESGHQEKSIQIAYLQYISQAEHFIYIENQFLISSVAGKTVKNQICQALVDRIKLAAKKEQAFRVVIVMPLLPGFEGEIQSSGVMKAQLDWEYKTISRHTDSIYSQLDRDPHISDSREYLQIFGLRTHQRIGGTPITEQIYVHSKMMLVDDRLAIIGSANINDRSQSGGRDSELAVAIEQEGPQEVVKALRSQVFQEHFGLSPQEAEDPMRDTLFTQLRDQAQANTEIYRRVFGCYPDDFMTTMTQVEQVRAASDLRLYDALKTGIRGNAVEFPTQFLSKESLAFRPLSDIEYILPDISFT